MNNLDNMKRDIDENFGVNIMFSQNFFKELEDSGYNYEFLRLTSNFGVLKLTNETYVQGIRNIVQFGSVMSIDKTIRMAPLSIVSEGTENGIAPNDDINSNYFKNNPNLSIDGRGAIIAVADTGIDYLHNDFIYPDGTTKILYLWDQTQDGKHPDGFFIGTEYTREDINKAIAEKDPNLSKDEVGSGTMISGICAGLGTLNPEYAGVAEGSELIVIKLEKIDGYYNNAMLEAALQYAFLKSKELDRPLVFNISQGSNSELSLSNLDLPKFYDRGNSVISGIGNEGNTETHTMGRLMFNGDVKEIVFELGEDEDDLTIEIWIERPDQMNVQVISPAGETSSDIESLPNLTQVNGLFDLEDTKYSIIQIFPDFSTGQQFNRIYLSDVKKGVWTIKLTGISILRGRYNAYLPNRFFLKNSTRFRNPDPSFTINYPSNANEIVSVGAYDSASRGLWVASSRGPTIQGALRPDFIAPGLNIIAPYPGNTYGKISGTSASAAHVSGAAAMYFQYTLVDEKFVNQAYVSNFKTFIKLGASQNSNIIYPNNSYGYGLIDLKKSFDIFSRRYYG